MIKISMQSDDVAKQIEVLRHFPDLAEKHYRPVLKRDVKLLEGIIQPNIPTLTGRAQNTFGSKVSGRGFRMKGQVGWYDKDDPWYINIVEHGAEAHDINSYAPGLGRYVREHPGFSERGFMAAGYSAVQPVIENDLALANERIIADLAAI